MQNFSNSEKIKCKLTTCTSFSLPLMRRAIFGKQGSVVGEWITVSGG